MCIARILFGLCIALTFCYSNSCSEVIEIDSDSKMASMTARSIANHTIILGIAGGTGENFVFDVYLV